MSNVKDICTELANVHNDVDMESFTNNVAQLFNDEQMENIAGVVLGISYKDGMTTALTYVADGQNTTDVFNNIFGTITSGLKKFIEAGAEVISDVK